MTNTELKEMDELGIPFLQAGNAQNVFFLNLAIGVFLILTGFYLIRKSKLKHKSIIGWLFIAVGLTTCFTRIMEWIN